MIQSCSLDLVARGRHVRLDLVLVAVEDLVDRAPRVSAVGWGCEASHALLTAIWQTGPCWSNVPFVLVAHAGFGELDFARIVGPADGELQLQREADVGGEVGAPGSARSPAVPRRG